MNKEEVDEIIRSRRSVYPVQLSGKRIPDDELHDILENANWAPTHKYTEPWRFKIFRDAGVHKLLNFQKELYVQNTPEDEIKEKKLKRFDEKAEKLSHVLAIIMHRDPDRRIPEVEEICSVAAAVQNIHLSLSSRGYGGYWSTGGGTFTDQMHGFLGLKENERCLGFFQMGVYEGPKLKGRRGKIEDKISFVD